MQMFKFLQLDMRVYDESNGGVWLLLFHFLACNIVLAKLVHFYIMIIKRVYDICVGLNMSDKK